MSYKNYPKPLEASRIIEHLNEYARLKHEYGAEDIDPVLNDTMIFLERQLQKILNLKEDEDLAAKEPNELSKIKALRNSAQRNLWKAFDGELYRNRLKGALIGRFAGCTLGAPVEFWPIEAMESWAKWIGDEFPNTDYWSSIKSPNELRYGKSPCHAYTRPGLDGVPVDDDITYTLLGLLIAEDYGLDFNTEHVGKAWLKYLPYACTAEDAALTNLKNGVPADKSADIGNPYVQWIGADIRSDPFGYLAPGLPEKAAEMAYYDAYVSHRRNGIYGEMFFSAAIAAAFAYKNPIDALIAALNEIPRECMLYKDIEWAIEKSGSIRDYRHARETVDEYFSGMSGVHTNNNAALAIFGLALGKDDFTKAISQTVAMGLDNDCTGATVGSLFGASFGIDAIPVKWYEKFGNKIYTYMTGREEFRIDEVINRFETLAAKNFSAV